MTETPRPGADPANPAISLGQDQPTGSVPPDQTGAAAGGPLTDEDRDVVRSAAIMAAALVSHAESGFFDTFRESFAASKAVKTAPPAIRDLFVQGGLPSMPRAGSREELEAAALDRLRQAMSTLRAKAPDLVESYRTTVVQSCRDVAAAADDTSANESQVMARVEQALA
ncbi:MAG TPA: hypothetical protein VFY88_02475 [Intrasporangium sp.]|nr:hypothetical protein [Intrasporangium sp.]